MTRISGILFALALTTTAALGAEITGRVVAGDGIPVEHAKLDTGGDGPTVFSDSRGRFTLPQVEKPALLTVTHPRFEPQVLSLSAENTGPLEIRLLLKQAVFEEIAVTAQRGEEGFAPVSVATAVLEPTASEIAPVALTEVISRVPAVSENGQGGLFQTYSIRGVSRQRVLTLISGMRIVSDRRAGVAASFLDPLLMGSVDVLKGPSSTYYGSGALGGVVQVFPQLFSGWSTRLGYEGQGNESYLAVGWGSDQLSLGLARRRAGEGESADGSRLHSSFEQTGMTAQRSWDSERLHFDLQAIGSLGRNIGKASNDFPDRTTTYPEEDHLLVRLAIESSGSWRFEGWVHPNALKTRVDEGSGRTDSVNRAFDLGWNWQWQAQPRSGLESRLGVEYFGRRSVSAEERSFSLVGGDPLEVGLQKTVDDAGEDELGLYGAVEWNRGPATLLAGCRIAWLRQQNEGDDTIDDAAVSGFGGVVVPLGLGFELVGNVGSGLRFPSLGERFFSGVTGRGEVVGNPSLEPERSLSLDAGLRWYGDSLFVAAYLFHNRIEDYVERVELDTDSLTFVNLTSGTIEGWELEVLYRLSEAWALTLGGHGLEGRAEGGGPLADIPADSIYLEGEWKRKRWSVRARWEGRASKTDAGSGEKAIPAASLLSASFDARLRKGLHLTLNASNLLNEEYFNSADRKVPLAAGRSLGVGLRWRG